MRLTDKVSKNYRAGEVLIHCTDEFANRMYQKLLDLEDIEEKYNIDIIKAVNLCEKSNEQGIIYYKEWGIIKSIKFINLDIEIMKHRLYGICINEKDMYLNLDLNRYGKTWALTEEELEK